jgi:hypothetical protein
VRSNVQLVPGPPVFACSAGCAWQAHDLAKTARRSSEGAKPGLVAASFAWQPAIPIRGRSSVGRAVALQASGRRFDPDRLHQSSPAAQATPGKPVASTGSDTRTTENKQLRNMRPRYPTQPHVFARFDIVKAGLAGLHIRLIHKTPKN